MARAKRQKPSDPEAARLARRVRELTDVGLQPEAAVLAAHSEVEVTRIAEERPGQSGKKVAHTVARRMDAFESLKAGMVDGAYDAARRLERAMIVRKGEGDRGRRMGRLDCEGGRDIADLMLEAGDEVEAVRVRLAPRDWWLLVELIDPPLDRGTWRDHVAYITGEENRDGQGAIVRHACANLRDAYQDTERRAAA